MVVTPARPDRVHSDGIIVEGDAVAESSRTGRPNGAFTLRHCPPAHSPLTFGALLRATVSSTTARSGHIRDVLGDTLRTRFRAPHVGLYDSGTHALSAALSVASAVAGPDRPVALPAFTCYDVATAAIGAGVAGVILYDVDAETLAPDWESFEAALAAGAGTAVVASLYGFPVNWDVAESIAQRYGTLLIEDAAQGSGGQWQGRPIGSFGAMTVLSFGRGKGWTGGGGGALLLRTQARPPLAPMQASLGREARTATMAAAQWLLSHPAVYAIPAAMPWLHLGETRFRTPTAPRQIADWSAALVLATADGARHEAGVRAAIAARYAATFRDIDEVIPARAVDGGIPGYLRYPLRVPNSRIKDEMLRAFARDGAAATYPTTLADLPELQSLLVRRNDFPGADTLVRELITLPTHSNVRRTLRASFADWIG